MFIPLMRFLLSSFVSNSFLVLLRYSFFFHLCLFDGVCFQYSQEFVSFIFSECSDFFLDSVVLRLIIMIIIIIIIIIIIALIFQESYQVDNAAD